MYFQKPPLGTPLDWSNPLNDGLVMHLAMNEGHGDKVQDLSLNGNHGTLHNFAFPPTVASGWNPGQTGVGLNFDGANDYISVPIDALDLQTPLTWSVITRVDVGAVRVVARSEAWGNGYLFVSPDGTVKIEDDSDHTVTYNIGAFNLHEWQHFVFVFDETNFITYRNGVQLGSASLAELVSGFNFDRIGKGGAADYHDGSIDQVRIYNRALTAKEVKDYTINPWQVYLDE